MGSKHDVLTESEAAGFRLRPEVSGVLRGCAERFGVTEKALRVLDWGCGRGLTVIKLLDSGIDAYGVDIDAAPIRNGAPLMRQHGHDPEQRLTHIDADCRTPFADGFFHLVLSDQVFEHVRDLDALVRELARITRPGGAGLHFFPARWTIIEPHLKVPCAHWLPKNALRHGYLRLMLRRIPAWKELEGRPAAEQARAYYEYSVSKTYYRPLRVIRDAFTRQGLDLEFLASGRPGRILRRILQCLPSDSRWASRLRVTWPNIFGTVAISTTRR